jgi:hypothetical protein
MNWRRLLAVLVGLAALPVTFCLLATLAAKLLQVAYGWNHPADYSAGDTAAWAMIIMSPVLLPIFAILSIAVAGVVYVCMLRLGDSNKVQDSQKK